MGWGLVVVGVRRLDTKAKCIVLFKTPCYLVLASPDSPTNIHSAPRVANDVLLTDV